MKAKFLLAGLLVALCLFSFHGRAQDVDSMLRDTASQLVPLAHDSALAPAAGPILPSNNIGGIPVPAWLQTALIALVTMLPFVQLLLKRIPTPYSVRLSGIVGKILDFLTWFQKDQSSNGTVHKILIFLLIGAALAMPAHAQTTVTPTDSTYSTWGFGVNATPAGFTLDGVYHVGAGASVCYQKVDYNYATKTTTVLHSYNFIWVPLVTGQPITSIKNFAMLGGTYGFDHNHIQLGPFFYPPGSKIKNQIGVMAIIGLNL